MAPSKHVGLIGFGAIGRDLHAQLSRDSALRLTVLVRSPPDGQTALCSGITFVHSLDELISAAPALVVEAAGQEAVQRMVPALLDTGISVVVASSGALGDTDLLARVTHIAERSASRLIVPSGAIGGLDYLAALHGIADARIHYTSRKPTSAWAQELRAMGHDPVATPGEVVLFEGSAAEAARLYPRNLNAGLTVALAAGHDRTTVRAVADPKVERNTHEITVESSVGSAFMSFANLPSPTNPKTSALTALSLAAAVYRHFDPVII